MGGGEDTAKTEEGMEGGQQEVRGGRQESGRGSAQKAKERDCEPRASSEPRMQ